MYVVDIWGGPLSQEYVARYIFKVDKFADVCIFIEKELSDGNLVNVRTEIAWGSDENFDTRVGTVN